MPNTPKYTFPRHLLFSTSENKKRALKRATRKAKRARALAIHRTASKVAASGLDPMAIRKTIRRKGGKQGRKN